MSKGKTDITTGSAKMTPGPKNIAAIDQAVQTFEERPVRLSVQWEEGPEGMIAGSPHADEVGHAIHLRTLMGTTSSTFAIRQLGYLEHATRERDHKPGQSASEVNSALAIVQAVGPQDELEGALAVQMASCHVLTMEMLGRAKTTKSTAHIELYGNMAVKLQRTFAAQIEALGRMRGKGQQTVRVEHVNVHPGGQAIVGDVHHHAAAGGGNQSKSEEQPHGTKPPETRAALSSPDTLANGVSISGNAERKVPAARRAKSRRAARE